MFQEISHSEIIICLILLLMLILYFIYRSIYKKFIISDTYYYFNNVNYPILITEDTINITPYTFQRNGQMWENLSIQQFFNCIDNEKYNIIDIGAQSGLYSLFAKYLPNSTFYSFEPFEESYNCLNENLELNNINNVNTYNIGISDKNGSFILNTSKENNGLHTMGENPLRFKDIKPITIKTITLDDFFYNKNIPVHFIKIDTEGWEYNILKGAKLTINKYKPIIQLEWNITNMKQCNINESDLLYLLNKYNYYEKSMVEEEKLFYPKYFKFNIPNNCNHVKLDIGLSYCAPQSQSWLSKEPNLMVFGFEPNPEAVENIKAGNIQLRDPSHNKPLDKKHLDSGRIIIINKALSNVEKEDKMNFYVNSKDCGTSSLYTHDEKYLGPIEKIIKVPVLSLKMFFDEFPWDRFEYIDYIKIDTQGSDLNILKGAGNYLRERVVFVTAEPDGYQYIGADDCNESNISEYMLSQNFIKINHPNTNDPTYVNKKFMDLAKSIYIEQR